MSMLKVSVSERDFTIRDQRLWGASLWNDTVAKPHDAGCDHAMLDEVMGIGSPAFDRVTPASIC